MSTFRKGLGRLLQSIGLHPASFIQPALGAQVPETHIDPRLQLASRDLSDLFPQAVDRRIERIEFEQTYGEMPSHELEALCLMVAVTGPRTIFEIGTFLGGTTIHLAANSEAQVYTLDLGTEDATLHKMRPGYDPASDVSPDESGRRFRQSAYSARITQLLGDSQRFDSSVFAASMGFIFVDGCHQYEYVVSDSRNALAMLSERGLIVWHDYAAYEPGVVQALNELGQTIRLVHVKGTSLVVYQRNAQSW